MSAEIVVLPFPHPGHIFPATELCNQLAGHGCHVTFFCPSTSSPSSLGLHPSIEIVVFFNSHPIQINPFVLQSTVLDLLDQRFNGPDPRPLPACAIVDEMISGLIDGVLELKIPAVSFFTSSASSAAIEHATWKNLRDGQTPGRNLTIPGLPDGMGRLTAPAGLFHRGPPFGPGHHHHHERGHGGGPHHGRSGNRRPMRRGLSATDGAIALLFNTCDELERPFLDYLAKEVGRPVWGVGPLLPAGFWAAAGTPVQDRRRESDVSEAEVLEWLDSKPRASVIYVAFGSLVSPADDELAELAAGLEASNRPFVWVIRAANGGFSPDGLARRAGARGLVIRGWAPQLTILSHVATGAYVCHCGWNSTVESLGCGVPLLTWPVRGDQVHNARLVTDMMRVGYPIRRSDGREEAMVTRADVVDGIERVMGDGEMRKRAADVRSIFAAGFPGSSSASLDCFLDFVSGSCQHNEDDTESSF